MIFFASKGCILSSLSKAQPDPSPGGYVVFRGKAMPVTQPETNSLPFSRLIMHDMYMYGNLDVQSSYNSRFDVGNVGDGRGLGLGSSSQSAQL